MRQGGSNTTDYFRFLKGMNRLVLSQRAKKRRRRLTWAQTEIGNDEAKKAAEAKVEVNKAAVCEMRGASASGSEAVAWGIVRALLKKG